MVDITYVTISPYKYTFKLPHSLTPSHILTIVLKTEPVIDSVKVLGHWVIGQTIESLVEPHD